MSAPMPEVGGVAAGHGAEEDEFEEFVVGQRLGCFQEAGAEPLTVAGVMGLAVLRRHAPPPAYA